MGLNKHRVRQLWLAAAAMAIAMTAASVVPGPMRIAAAFSVNGHEDITADGLSERPGTEGFLRPAVQDDIADQHEQIDSGFSGGRDERHFDDCEFDGGVKYINDRYAETLAHLAAGRVWDATDAFGFALHPAQDIYSHSNWVELGFPTGSEATRADLINIARATRLPGLDWRVPPAGGVVRDDILLGSDDWNIPAGWTIERNGGGPFVPTLHNLGGTRVGRLLTSGEGRFDDECDVYVAGTQNRAFDGFEHSDLNKDDDSRTGYSQARKLAVLQTGYEWCRLMAKAGADGTDGLLAALWVRSNGRPHPEKTPCEEAPPGRTEVTVVIDSVRVLDDGDDSDNQPGEVQLAVALYNDPSRFTRSAHTMSRGGSIKVRNGEFIPTSRLPPPLTLCANYDERVTLALHGWDNDDPEGDPFANDFDDKDDDDEVLLGFQRRIGPVLPAGQQLASSPFLQVRYHFVRGGHECDMGAPANDDFDDATALPPTLRGEVNGSNAGASGEAGEPRHAGSAPDTSVWYRWTAPLSGTAVLSTAGSSFNTTLAIYGGSSVSSLTPVASNDNAAGTTTSRLAFRSIAGRTYHIAVNGVDAATGAIQLRWVVSVLPPNHPNFPNVDVPAKGESTSPSRAQSHDQDSGAPVAPSR
jgi:hypothetical protein